MDKVKILYDNLENGEPFCFIKLNDGEISAMIIMAKSTSNKTSSISKIISIK